MASPPFLIDLEGLVSMPKQQPDAAPSSTTGRGLSGLIWHPQETLILCVVSALDVIMTNYLLTRGDIHFTESNPVARYFLHRWGLAGMAYFKAAMTLFVCVITQIVARKNPVLARQVLGLATVIVVGVVIYSVWLHFKHHPLAELFQLAFTVSDRDRFA